MPNPTLRLLALLAVALPAPGASAQGFNVDVGDVSSFTPVSSGYGAASGQVGVWNQATSTSTVPYQLTLVDLSGVTSAVTTTVVSYGNGIGDFFFDNVSTTGDDQSLMDDFQDIGSGTSVTFWTFDNLIDGPYDLYTYAWAPDDATFVTSVTHSGFRQSVLTGGAWPGMHVEGVTYARHCIEVVGGQLMLEVQAVPAMGFATLNGIQLVPRATPCPASTVFGFCDGADGSLASCPCANPGASDSGCDIAQGTGGVQASVVGLDTVGLTATMIGTGFPPAATPTAIVIRGNDQEAAPVSFGDGLRCVGVTGFVRLASTNASGGQSTHLFTHSAGPGTFYYQIWFRNTPVTYCVTTGPSSGAFNLSNGQGITW